MKVLLVNNFYYNRGGDCTYLFSLKDILEKKGHKVIIFSMNHPQNYDNEYAKYFVSYINYDEEVKNVSIPSAFRVLNRTIYSFESKNKVEKLIQEERPDIVHLQNIHHHITPSIFYMFHKHKIPIVWTLHDYTIICPNTSFIFNGRICEKCKKTKYYWPSIIRCKKNSFGASTMAAFETIIHRLTKVNDLVDVFITPSDFLHNKFIEYGIPRNKLVRLNHFTNLNNQYKRNTAEDYYLYVGRIAEEKGVKTLIDAAIKVNSSKLKIAGSGPLSDELISYVRQKDKNKIIEFLGHKSQEELVELYENCKFIVVPSEWYEISGLIIFEAYACGKPAIGAKIGGIPELIKDTERGLVFEPGNSDELSSAIKFLLNNPDIVEEMGDNAREFIKQELTGEKHYNKLIEIYNNIISSYSNS